MDTSTLLLVGGNMVWWTAYTPLHQLCALVVRPLLAKFPSIISDGSSKPQPLHGVEHTIETAGQPVPAKARSLMLLCATKKGVSGPEGSHGPPHYT
jgi:hypothetical protein